MFSGVLFLSIIIILLIIGITVIVTIKAYKVTHSETIDPLPQNEEPKARLDD